MPVRIFWSGDSTVKQNDFTTFPQTGIGQEMRLFLKKEIEIANHAENGRSTKSFLDESRLAAIYNEISAGDFLFIQFGHNDEKAADPSRYTEPWGEYQENLERFVNAARNKKAYPLLITPLCRRWFLADGTLDPDIHGAYPEAMLATAARLEVPCIDLFRSSKALLEAMGVEASKKLFMNLKPGEYPNFPEGLEDNTHLRQEGAAVFAGLVAKGLKDLGGRYRELLLYPERL